MSTEFEVTVEPLGAAANPQSSLTATATTTIPMKSAVNVAQETPSSSSVSKPSTSFQADDIVGDSEKALLNSAQGNNSTLQVRRARRNVRLKSAPHEEFLLPPIASQENVNVALDEGGMPLPPVSPMSIAQGMVSAFSIVRKVSQRVSSSKKQQEPASAFRRRASRRASRRAAGQLRRAGSSSRRSPSATAATPSAFSRSPLIRPNGQVGANNGVEDAELGDPDDEDTDGEEGEKRRGATSGKEMVSEMIQSAWQQFLLMVGLRSEERKITSVAEIIKEPILEDLELPHRYRPQNMKTLCDATGFSISEMKRIYRGFKTECPSGLITEEAFHSIYSRFFPQGAPFIWSDIRGYVHCSGEWAGKKKVSKKEQKALDLQNAQAALSSYSHYVFSTLDRNDSGVITFQDFVVGLSILIRGTLEEKLRWTFSLYDQDRDGVISREEMEDVVGSVFDLMGRTGDPISEEAIITERVDQIFQKMDLNGDGVVSIEEFLESCQNDETISRSVQAFTNVHI